MTKNVKLTDLIAPSFYEVSNAIDDETHDEFWLEGGRGSTKSSFCPVKIITGIMQDPKASSICFRKVSNTLRDSIHAKFLWALDQLEVSHLFNAKVSPTEITYLPTDQKIILRGLDEPRRVKSITLEKGYFKYLWFEEADEFSNLEEIRTVKQSILRGGEKFVTLITYNPPKQEEHWINQEAKVILPNKIVHHSCYKEVPKEWLGNKFFKEAENLKRANYEAYLHEYEGQPIGNPEQIIFSGCYQVTDFEIEADHNQVAYSRFFQGVDFGDRNPTTMVRCYIKFDEIGRRFLYITHEAYGRKIPINKMSKLFEKVPNSRKWLTKGDVAQRQIVDYLAEPYDEQRDEKGFNIQACEKWANSVEQGIKYLKSFDMIYIHSSCKYTAEEFSKYSYKVDKVTKKVLGDEIVKEWDHCIDALRYALDDYIKQNVTTNYENYNQALEHEDDNDILDQDSW